MYPNNIGALWTLFKELKKAESHSDQLVGELEETLKAEKKKIAGAQHKEMVELVKKWEDKIKEQQGFYEQYQAQMEELRGQISDLHDQLMEADKHYRQTLKAKESEIYEKASVQQIRPEEFGATLQRLRRDFQVIAQKYQNLKLPGFVNYLNYVFSAQRKADYEQLILIRATAELVFHWVERMVPQMSSQQKSHLQTEYDSSLEELKRRHAAEIKGLKDRFDRAIREEEVRLQESVDSMISDEDLDRGIAASQATRKKLRDVQKTLISHEDVLVQAWFAVSVRQMFEGRTCGVIEKKFSRLMDGNGMTQFPTTVTADFPAHWMIDPTPGSELGVSLTHSFMYQMLASVPVSRLTYLVIDPEYQGASVTPFFEALQKIPDLFFQRKIVFNRQDITRSLNEVNQQLTSVLQTKLGSQYQDVYSAQEQIRDYVVQNYLLVLYDFPFGFDAASLNTLRKIMQMGPRCGAHVIIVNGNNARERSNDMAVQLQPIPELCMQVQVNGRSCSLFGLPFYVEPMPDQSTFSNFLSKYLLVQEGIRNQGIAFPPMIKSFVEESDEERFRQLGSGIYARLQGIGKRVCAAVPETTPESMDVGYIRYPSDIFGESPWFSAIQRSFGTPDGSGIVMPLSFELRRSMNLILESSGDGQREVTAMTDYLAWSFISSFPVNDVKLMMFDPVNMGSSARGVMDVLSAVPELFQEGQIIIRQDELIHVIDDLERHIVDFKNNKLGNEYSSFVDYNLGTKHRKVPARLLVFYDFPNACHQALGRIQNILKNGSQCGIYTVLCTSAQANPGRYEQNAEIWKQIRQMCTTIVCKQGRYMLTPFNLPVGIPTIPSGQVREEYLKKYQVESEKKKKKGFSLDDILPETLFGGNSRESLRIPVGVGDGDKVSELVIGVGQSHFGLISGPPGSGKSVLMHTIIVSAMMNYSPEELQLYLMDFKDGVEFKCYDEHHMPHIRLLALSAMQEFGLSILEELGRELNRRSDIFKAIPVAGLKEYRQRTGKKMPRILLVMDEFQNLYDPESNRKLADRCAHLTVDLIARGRSYGINILMATQSTKRISTLSLGKDSIEMMRMRIGLKCNENDCYYLFGDSKSRDALRMMAGPTGTAVIDRDYMDDPLEGFRTAYISPEERERYLKTIETTFVDMEAHTAVFEGAQQFPLLDYCRQIHLSISRDPIPVIHLGNPIKVAPAYTLRMDRKIRHNLLICGSDDVISANLIQVYTFSALMNLNSTVYVVDGDRMTDEPGGGDYYAVYERFGSRFHAVEREKDIVQMIHNTYEKFLEWKQENSKEHVFIIVRSLQFVELIRRMLTGKVVREDEYLAAEEKKEEEALPEATQEDPFARFFAIAERRSAEEKKPASRSSDTNASVKLRTMISDGNAYGIHFVFSVSDYQTVRETMTMGAENTLNKFPERIIFSLNDNDAMRLIDGAVLSKMPKDVKHLVLINQDGVKQEDGSVGPYQLKPFIMPEADELVESLWHKKK